MGYSIKLKRKCESRIVESSNPLPFGNIKNQRDLVSIENLCALIALTVSHPHATNETFLISDGIARNTKEIVQLLAARQGKHVAFFNIPNGIFNLVKKFKPQPIERLTGDLQVDIAKTQAILGWNPHN